MQFQSLAEFFNMGGYASMCGWPTVSLSCPLAAYPGQFDEEASGTAGNSIQSAT